MRTGGAASYGLRNTTLDESGVGKKRSQQRNCTKNKKGIPVQIIAECTGLSEKEIEQR